MCEKSAAIVRGLYEAFNGGDLPAVWALLDPAVSFVEPPVSRVPYAGFHSGPRSVAAAIFRCQEEVWEGLQAVPHTLVDTGESVLALGLFKCVGLETGEPLCAPFLHECFFNGGRIARIHSYPETARAMRAPD